jgi:hypothetical protein
MVDVTPQVQETVVEVKPEPQPVAEQPKQEMHALDQQFQQELKQEPEKRGFWARLFGKK